VCRQAGGGVYGVMQPRVDTTNSSAACQVCVWLFGNERARDQDCLASCLTWPETGSQIVWCHGKYYRAAVTRLVIHGSDRSVGRGGGDRRRHLREMDQDERVQQVEEYHMPIRGLWA
jgi:hypothetical protein